MPITGLLITLDEDPDKAATALRELAGREELELGERSERYIPLVAETSGDAAGRELHRWIERRTGVYFVDTVFASVEKPVKENEKIIKPDRERYK